MDGPDKSLSSNCWTKRVEEVVKKEDIIPQRTVPRELPPYTGDGHLRDGNLSSVDDFERETKMREVTQDGLRMPLSVISAPEDTDTGLALARGGHRPLVVPQSSVHHQDGESSLIVGLRGDDDLPLNHQRLEKAEAKGSVSGSEREHDDMGQPSAVDESLRQDLISTDEKMVAQGHDEGRNECTQKEDIESLVNHLMNIRLNIVCKQEAMIFEGDLSKLLFMASRFFEELNPENVLFVPKEIWQCNAICALHHIFQLIGEVTEMRWDMFDDQSPFFHFKNKIEDIINATSDSFKTHHYSLLLRDSIMGLSASNKKTDVRCECTKVWRMAKSCPQMWNDVIGMLTFRMDLDSIERGVSSIRQLLSSIVPQKHWPVYIQWLNSLALAVIEDHTTFDAYQNALRCVLYEEASMKDKETRKHLRYGIIKQLTMLALEGSTEDVKKKSKELLDEVKTLDVTLKDIDIEKYISECTDRLETQGQESGTVADLGYIGRSQHDKGPSISTRLNPTTHAKTLFQLTWSEIIEQYSLMRSDSETCEGSKLLWKLKEGYRKQFAQTTSPVDKQKRELKTMKFYLKKLERRQDRLNLGDNDIVIHSNDQGLQSNNSRMRNEVRGVSLVDEDVSRVLVEGMPGVGKTTLARRLALDWSDGRWGSQFNALFLLPVSSLLDQPGQCIDDYQESLAVAISKSYSEFIDEPFEMLLPFVKRELLNSKTLVILDGMEEAKGDARRNIDEMINQRKHGQHTLLVFTRPCVEGIEVDATFKLCPLPIEDIQCNSIFHSQLQAHPMLLEIAQNPMYLQILSTIVSESDENIDSRLRRPADLYSSLAVKLWHLHKEKHSLETVSRDEAFEELGKLAMHGLILGKRRIPVDEAEVDIPHIIRKFSPDSRGLLLHYDNGDVEFTHSIVQNYFAGRHLADMLVDKQRDKRRVQECIRELKYGKHGDVLAVAAAELGQKRGTEGIEKLLTAIGTVDLDFLRLHNFRMRMTCIQQWLLEQIPQGEEYHKIDRQFQITLTLKHWLKLGMKSLGKGERTTNIEVPNVILSILKEFPVVIAHLKTVLLEYLLKKVKKKNWNVQPMVIEALALIADADFNRHDPWMQAIQRGLDDRSQVISKAVLKHMCVFGAVCKASIPLLLERLNTLPNRQRNNVYDETVIKLLQRAPEYLGENLETLVTVCKNTEYWVRTKAINAIPEILADDPSRAEQLITELIKRSSSCKRQLSVGEIEVLGICLKTHSVQSRCVVDFLRSAWKTMDEDQLKATVDMFVYVVRAMPEAATEVVKDLLGERQGNLWPKAFSILRLILGSFRESPEHANTVLDLIEKSCMLQRSLSSIALLLEAIKNFVQVSERSLSLSIPVVVDAFGHKEWTIRSEAFSAAGAIAKYQPMQLCNKLGESVIDGCKMEAVWRARCIAFEAASELVPLADKYPELIDVCIQALGDQDDIVRKFACRAVTRAISENIEKDDALLHKLLSAYQGSSNDARHGIVHTLHLVAQQHPDLIPHLEPILIEASSSQQSFLCSAAVAALRTVANFEEDVDRLVDHLIQAFRKGERNIQFVAVEGLTDCIKKNQRHKADLIALLKEAPNPLNANEWLVFLRALQSVADSLGTEEIKLLEILFSDSENELPDIYQIRKETIDCISMKQLLNWYTVTQTDMSVQEIVRRFLQEPVVLTKEDDKHWSGSINSNSSDERETFRIGIKLKMDIEAHLRRYMPPRRPWKFPIPLPLLPRWSKNKRTTACSTTNVSSRNNSKGQHQSIKGRTGQKTKSSADDNMDTVEEAMNASRKELGKLVPSELRSENGCVDGRFSDKNDDRLAVESSIIDHGFVPGNRHMYIRFSDDTAQQSSSQSQHSRDPTDDGHQSNEASMTIEEDLIIDQQTTVMSSLTEDMRGDGNTEHDRSILTIEKTEVPRAPCWGHGVPYLPNGATNNTCSAFLDLPVSNTLFAERYLVRNKKIQGKEKIVFAYDKESDSKVVLKFYETREKFENARWMYDVVNSQYVCRKLSEVEEPGFSPCIVFEKGEHSLKDCLNDNKHWAENEKKLCLQQILLAMSHLQERGIVHCNIKPSNILFCLSTHSWKLSNLDNARLAYQPARISYSLAYAAPEVLLAEEKGLSEIELGQSTDMWAVGIIAYEVYSGRRFYGLSTSLEQVKAYLCDRPCALPSLQQVEEPQVQKMIENLIVLEPDKRWPAKTVLDCSTCQPGGNSQQSMHPAQMFEMEQVSDGPLNKAETLLQSQIDSRIEELPQSNLSSSPLSQCRDLNEKIRSSNSRILHESVANNLLINIKIEEFNESDEEDIPFDHQAATEAFLIKDDYLSDPIFILRLQEAYRIRVSIQHQHGRQSEINKIQAVSLKLPDGIKQLPMIPSGRNNNEVVALLCPGQLGCEPMQRCSKLWGIPEEKYAKLEFVIGLWDERSPTDAMGLEQTVYCKMVSNKNRMKYKKTVCSAANP